METNQKAPMTKEEEIARAAYPMVEYLKENSHPHTKAIIDSNGVEIVEGVSNIPDVFNELANILKP